MLKQLILGLKIFFSITIFHKKIAIFSDTFYFAPKALKQGVWSIAVATKGHLAFWTFVATKLPQMLFLRGLGTK